MDCCLTNNDAHVASGSEDGNIYFWDLVDASVVSKFRAHASVVIFKYLLIFSFLHISINHDDLTFFLRKR